MLKPREIQSTIILVLLFAVVLPFVPNYTVDPWNLINPQNLVKVIALIASIQFASYVSVRVLGNRAGLMISGFLGGLVSSTTVFATLPRKVRENPVLLYPAIAASLLATLAMLLEVLTIVMTVAPKLVPRLSGPLGIMCAAGLTLALVLGAKGKTAPPQSEGSQNPLDLKSVLKLSALVSGLLMSVELVQRSLGKQAFQITIFLASLFELHGVTFSVSDLFARGNLSETETMSTLALGISAAFFSKIILLWSLDRGQFALRTSEILLAIVALGGGAFWLLI